MIVVIFQVEARDGRARDYFDLAAALKAEVEKIDGFISVERFESLSAPGRYLSLSLWRDEAAVTAWRQQARHRSAQDKGRTEIFRDFRITVAEVVRDYVMADRMPAGD